jgi:hypothetical protein
MNQENDHLIKGVLADIPLSLQKVGFASFSVFYSNPWNTLEKGKYYIVGLNPGGLGEASNRQDYESLKPRCGSDDNNNWSAYLVEDEGKWPSTLQPNMAAFAEQCLTGGREGLRNIFSTNAVFARTPDVNGIEEHGSKAIILFESICWPWHLKFLDIVRPEIIIAISNGEGGSPSAYQLFSKHLECPTMLGDPIKTYGRFSIKGRKGKLRLASGLLDVCLLGLPHFSYWSPTSASSLRALVQLRERGWLD